MSKSLKRRQSSTLGTHIPTQKLVVESLEKRILLAGDVTASLGTLAPGKSITIQYEATVDSNFPKGLDHIFNQATVASDQGTTVSDPTNTPVDRAPQVANVYFNSTFWSPGFRSNLNILGIGHPTFGYTLPGATPNAFGKTQLDTLPWPGLDEVSFEFTKPIDIELVDLSLHSIDPITVSGPALNGSNTVATFSLSPVGSNKLRFTLDGDPGGVTDIVGNQLLDGEFIDGGADLNSGDGTVGGDFSIRANVQPGDPTGDGSSTITDTIGVRNRQFSTLLYDPYFDIDGSGPPTINIIDVIANRNTQFSDSQSDHPEPGGTPGSGWVPDATPPADPPGGSTGFLNVSKSEVLTVDIDGDLEVDPGDTVLYTVTIENPSSNTMDANGVTLDDCVHPNVTVGNIGPAALPDSYIAFEGTTLTVGAAQGLLDNDFDIDAAVPPGTITTIGGVTPVGPVQGALVLNGTAGGFTYTPPASGFGFTDTFSYEVVDDDFLISTGIVMITVDPPLVDNPPSVNITTPTSGSTIVEGQSIPFEATATDDVGVTQVEFFVDGTSIFIDNTAPFATTFTVPGSPDPLNLSAIATDTIGQTGSDSITVIIDNPPTVTITAPANGSTVTEGDGVTFTANATDDVGVAAVEFFVDGVSIGVDITAPFLTTFVAPAGPSPLPLSTLVTDTAGLTASDSISITIQPAGVPPTANDDGPFDVIGNVGISVPAGSGVFFNDTLGTPAATISAFDATSLNGGDVTMNSSTGAFTYTPPAGFDGSDQFDYTLMNASGSSTATVSLSVSDMIWFIDSSAAAGGDGRLNSPFQGLVGGANDFESNAADAAGDSIFVADGSYNGGLSLLNSQLLIGDGSSGTLFTATGIPEPSFTFTLPSFSGTDPTVTTAGSNGINLASGNTIRGLTIGNTSTGTGIFGSSVGSATIGETSINGTGEGINITTGTLAMSFDEISSSNNSGINLNGVSGSFSVNTGTINSGTNTAVSIDGNPSIFLGTSLTSVSSSGAVNGIILTDTTGSFTVTGTGTPDSGGVIQNTVGDNNEFNTSGDGIALNNASNVNLNRMRIEDFGDHGINIQNVTNFQLKNSVLNDDHTQTIADDDEQGILINGLFGQSLIQDVNFNAINEDGIEVISSTSDDATTDELTLRRVTFQNHQGANGEHGIDYRPTGSSNTRLLIDDSDFIIDGDGAIGAFLSPRGSSSAEIIVRNSLFDGTTAFGSGGVEARTSGSTTTKYLIEGNTFDENNFFPLAVLNDGGTMDATVRNNLFPNTTAPNAGAGGTRAIDTAIFVRQDQNGTARVLIDNNNITGSAEFRVIEAIAQDGTGQLDITITNNTFAEPDSVNFASGIILQSGVSSTGGHSNTLRAQIDGNVGVVTGGFAGFLGFGEGIGIAERTGTTFQLEAGVSGSSDPAVVLGANNPGIALSGSPGGTELFVHDNSDGSVAIVANGTVNTPTLPTDPTLLLAAGGEGSTAVGVLNQAELDAVTEAAIDRLSNTGLRASQVAILEAVEFEITDLAAGVLGSSEFFSVQIDMDAAGHGWFVDSTPWDDEEFGADLVADRTSEAWGRVDLLTVVMHELGHMLNRDHADEDTLMGETLDLSTRHLPAIDEIFVELGEEDHRERKFRASFGFNRAERWIATNTKFAIRR